MPRKQDEYLEPERGETDTRTQDWDPLEGIRWKKRTLRLIVHTLFEEKIWVQNKMPETNVNRLARNIENAQKLVENINTEIRRKYYSRYNASMSANGRKLVRQREETIQKIMNMNSKLKTMNQAAIQVKIRKIDDELTRLTKALGNQSIRYNYEGGNYPVIVSREYGRWYRETMDPKERSTKIKKLEEKLRNMHPAANNKLGRFIKNHGRLELNRTKLIIERNILRKALALRKKHIGPEKPARNRFRSLVAQKVLPPIVQNINYAPYGRKTLNAIRRFPGYKEPSLENYARARREINRLQRELKRKRNNNNRN